MHPHMQEVLIEDEVQESKFATLFRVRNRDSQDQDKDKEPKQIILVDEGSLQGLVTVLVKETLEEFAPLDLLRREYEILKLLTGVTGVLSPMHTPYEADARTARSIAVFRNMNGVLLEKIIQSPSTDLGPRFLDMSASLSPEKTFAPIDFGSDIELFLKAAIKLTRLLGHIHERGVIHRDIRSGTIILDYDKERDHLALAIVDFTLAIMNPYGTPSAQSLPNTPVFPPIFSSFSSFAGTGSDNNNNNNMEATSSRRGSNPFGPTGSPLLGAARPSPRLGVSTPDIISFRKRSRSNSSLNFTSVNGPESHTPGSSISANTELPPGMATPYTNATSIANLADMPTLALALNVPPLEARVLSVNSTLNHEASAIIGASLPPVPPSSSSSFTSRSNESDEELDDDDDETNPNPILNTPLTPTTAIDEEDEYSDFDWSLAYISPELTGRVSLPVDQRSDFYSLGVTFYEMLTGRLPFTTTVPVELVHSHIALKPHAVHDARPGVPIVLSAIIGKLMAKHPNERYQSAYGLLWDLETVFNQFKIEKAKIVVDIAPANPPMMMTRQGSNPSSLSISSPSTTAPGGGSYEQEMRLKRASSISYPGTAADVLMSDTSPLTPDNLGRRDLYYKLMVPTSVIFGREAELHQIDVALDRFLAGSVEFVVISGASGVGKTSLVRETQSAISPGRYLTISGKCDQFNQNIPYAPLVAALQSLITHLLGLSESAVASYRQAFLQRLGSNIGLLQEIMPDLHYFLGPQSAVRNLPPAQSQARFDAVLMEFIRIFTTRGIFLCIFLDDLQWADPDTLRIVEQLMSDPEAANLCIIAVTRDTSESGENVTSSGGLYSKPPSGPDLVAASVMQAGSFGIDQQQSSSADDVWVGGDSQDEDDFDAVGALMHIVARLQLPTAGSVNVTEILLGPLNMESVNQLVAYTVHSKDLNRTTPLSEIVQRKALGNPFFVLMLLKSLARNCLLRFNEEHGRWEWDMAHILSISLSDNVLNVMVHNMEALSAMSRSLLKIAACVGAEFDLQLLAMLCNMNPKDTLDSLHEALVNDLIVLVPTPASTSKLPHSPLLHCTASGNNIGTVAPSERFRFVHDRVRQAAYAAETGMPVTQLHLLVGRTLMLLAFPDHLPVLNRRDSSPSSSSPGTSTTMFDIAHHLNFAMSMMDDEAELTSLASLNLQVGQRSKISGSYRSAQNYLQMGLTALRRREMLLGLESLPTLVSTSTPGIHSGYSFPAAHSPSLSASVDGLPNPSPPPSSSSSSSNMLTPPTSGTKEPHTQDSCMSRRRGSRGRSGDFSLGNNTWGVMYALAYGLHLELAECEFILGNDSAAQALCDSTLKRSQSSADKVEVYGVMIQQYTARGRCEDAVATATDCLKFNNISLNEKIVEKEVYAKYLRMKERLEATPGQERDLTLTNLPDMEADSPHRPSLKILAMLLPSANVLSIVLMMDVLLHMFDISLDHGNTEWSAVAYMWLAGLIGPIWQEFTTAVQIGTAALAIIDRFPSEAAAGVLTHTLYGAFVNPIMNNQPILRGIRYLKLAHAAALESGMHAHATTSVIHMVTLKLMASSPLEPLMEEIQKHVPENSMIQLSESLMALKVVSQLVRNLRGQTLHQHTYSTTDWDEAAFEAEVPLWRSAHPPHYFIFRMMSSYLYHNYKGVLVLAKKNEPHLNRCFGHPVRPMHYFYYMLAILALHKEWIAQHGQELFDATAAHVLKELDHYGVPLPNNYGCYPLIARGELQRVEGKYPEAIDLFSQAAALANKNGLLVQEAIANELCGRACLSSGFEKKGAARMYLVEAVSLYAQWGATGKVQDMSTQYASVLQGGIPAHMGHPMRGGDGPSVVPGVSPLTIVSEMYQSGAGLRRRSSTPHVLQALDLGAVLTASRSLSGEINLHRLTSRLMKMLMVNAGAQKGFLLLSEDDFTSDVSTSPRGTPPRVDEDSNAVLGGTAVPGIMGLLVAAEGWVEHVTTPTSEMEIKVRVHLKADLVDNNNSNNNGGTGSGSQTPRANVEVIKTPSLNLFTSPTPVFAGSVAAANAVTMPMGARRSSRSSINPLVASSSLPPSFASSLPSVSENVNSPSITPSRNPFMSSVGSAERLSPVLHKDDAILLSGSGGGGLEMSHSIVNYVKRVLSPVVLQNAATERQWANDEHIARTQAKSLMCLPITHQGKLEALLYMENNLVSGAFTQDRMHVLDLLCSQAAISIQNSRLFLLSERAKKEAVKANEAKSSFMSNMSHEMRTPLNGILGSLDLMERSNLTPEQQDLFSVIMTSSDILLGMVNNLLDLSRVESGKITCRVSEFNILRVVEDCLEGVSHEAYKKGLELVYDMDWRLPTVVKSDPGILRQVINNLLVNALKFTTKGQIKVRVQLDKVVESSHYIHVTVSDTGIGIRQDELARLFGRFYQADSSSTKKYAGCGLGLFISHQLVQVLRGTIGVRSRWGVGSQFYFTFPVEQAEFGPTPDSPRNALSSVPLRNSLSPSVSLTKNIAVIVVEPHRAVCHHFSSLLKFLDMPHRFLYPAVLLTPATTPIEPNNKIIATVASTSPTPGRRSPSSPSSEHWPNHMLSTSPASLSPARRSGSNDSLRSSTSSTDSTPSTSSGENSPERRKSLSDPSADPSPYEFFEAPTLLAALTNDILSHADHVIILYGVPPPPPLEDTMQQGPRPPLALEEVQPDATLLIQRSQQHVERLLSPLWTLLSGNGGPVRDVEGVSAATIQEAASRVSGVVLAGAPWLMRPIRHMLNRAVSSSLLSHACLTVMKPLKLQLLHRALDHLVNHDHSVSLSHVQATITPDMPPPTVRSEKRGDLPPPTAHVSPSYERLAAQASQRPANLATVPATHSAITIPTHVTASTSSIPSPTSSHPHLHPHHAKSPSSEHQQPTSVPSLSLPSRSSTTTTTTSAGSPSSHAATVPPVESRTVRIVEGPRFGFAPPAVVEPVKLRNVLVAEDNNVNAKLICKMLDRIPVSVILMANGQTALDTFKAADPPFDLVLMDLFMPVLDGYSSTAAIRAFEAETGRGRTPIVAITANAMRGEREKCIAAGFDDFLTKPVKFKEVDDIIRLYTHP